MKISNVCIYARFSSAKQQELSIEAQVRLCKEFCDRNNYVVKETYIDRALSGSKDTEKRLAFLQMIDKSKLYDAIVVYSLDRFSRNEYDQAIYERKLEENGCVLLSATESNDFSAQGNLMRKIFKDFAVYYVADLKQKVKRGMYQAQLNHRYIGSVVPFGYNIVNKQYEINQDQAPIVKEIFERVCSGEAYLDIANSLNSRGIKTSKGQEWGKSSFHRIIENEKYRGAYSYTTPEGIRQTDENCIPRIVSDDLWYKAQETKQRRKVKPTKYNYLFSGRLYYYDTIMYGSVSTNRGKSYPYYFCITDGVRRSIKKDLLEKQVFSAIQSLVNEDFIESICKQAYEENERQINDDPYTKQLEADIKDHERKIGNCLQLIIEMPNDERIKNMYNSLQAELENLKSEYADRKYLTKHHFSIEDFRDFFTSFLCGDIEDDIFKQTMCGSLIKKIVLHSDNTFELYLNTRYIDKCCVEFPMVDYWLVYTQPTYSVYLCV